MKKISFNIYNWIKNPDEKKLNISLKEKFTLSLQILFLDLLISIPFVGLSYFIHYHVIKLKEPLIDHNPLLIVLLVVLFVPILEEFIFRFPLKFERNYLARSINYLTKGWLIRKWNSVSKYFLYLLILTFGLIHLSNYDNREFLFYVLAPIIVGSQLIGGITLSYSRIKLGFVWGIFQHGAFNLLVTLIGVLFFHNQNILSVSNENLTIEMKELMFIDKKEAHYQSKSENKKIYSIEANDISLFQLIDSLGIKGAKPYDNTWITISMSSKIGITKIEFINLLKKELKFDN